MSITLTTFQLFCYGLFPLYGCLCIFKFPTMNIHYWYDSSKLRISRSLLYLCHRHKHEKSNLVASQQDTKFGQLEVSRVAAGE